MEVRLLSSESGNALLLSHILSLLGLLDIIFVVRTRVSTTCLRLVVFKTKTHQMVITGF